MEFGSFLALQNSVGGVRKENRKVFLHIIVRTIVFNPTQFPRTQPQTQTLHKNNHFPKRRTCHCSILHFLSFFPSCFLCVFCLHLKKMLSLVLEVVCVLQVPKSMFQRFQEPFWVHDQVKADKKRNLEPLPFGVVQVQFFFPPFLLQEAGLTSTPQSTGAQDTEHGMCNPQFAANLVSVQRAQPRRSVERLRFALHETCLSTTWMADFSALVNNRLEVETRFSSRRDLSDTKRVGGPRQRNVGRGPQEERRHVFCLVHR